MVLATAMVAHNFYIAPYPVEVVGVQGEWDVVAGQASTVAVTKDTGTTAAGGGTAVMTNTFDMTSAVRTINKGTLTTTRATLQLATGDRLGLVFTGSATSCVGLTISALLKKI